MNANKRVLNINNNVINISDLKNYYNSYVYSNNLQFALDISTTNCNVTLSGDDLTIEADLRGNNYTVSVTVYDPKFTYDALDYDGVTLNTNNNNSNFIDTVVLNIEELPPVRFKDGFSGRLTIDKVDNIQLT